MEENLNDLHFLHSQFEPYPNGNTIDLKSFLQEENFLGNMVGRSLPMKELFKRIEQISCTSSNILIEGPKGGGKKLVARTIHQIGGGNDNTIMSIKCSTVSNNFLGSEFFLKKADSLTKGEALFFEEIGDLSLIAQEELLAVLGKTIGGNIRLMASTSVCLEDKISAGEFDGRLFQYFVSERIGVPSLNEHREDIPLLLAYFFEKYSENRICLKIETDAFNRLLLYDWPGNIRELENQVERWMASKYSEIIKSSYLPDKFFQKFDGILLTSDGIDLKKVLSDIEDSLIKQALKMTGDNKNKASKLLKINRTTLIEKMKKKGFLKPNQEILSK